MATTKKASPAQIAARKLFAERAKAGTLTKKRKPAAKKTAVKKYSGKYPTRIKGVSSSRIKGTMIVALNNGEVHHVTSVDTGGIMPRIGQDIFELFPETKRKSNPIKKTPASLPEHAKSYATQLKRKGVFSKAVGYYPSKTSPDYELVALFNTHAEAVAAATMYAQNHPKYQWFVKTI